MYNDSELNPISVSVVIPAFNEESYIGYCLESIKKLDTKNVVTEVIVIDNGSSDNTIQLCESYGVKVLVKTKGTISSLRNHGAKASKSDIVAFLDADCTVPEDWLQKSLNYLKSQRLVVLGFRLSVPNNSNWIAQCWDLLFVKRYITSEVEWVPTGNMIMTRETFALVGGFDEQLETNEDYDFCFRAKMHNCTIISSAETSVTHFRPPNSIRQIIKKELWHGKEVLNVFLKDIVENKNFFIYRRKNFKVIAFSVFFLIIIILLMASLIIGFTAKIFAPLIIGAICPILVSFLMAIRYVISSKKYKLIFGMTLLLMIYGFSRALSLLSLAKSRK